MFIYSVKEMCNTFLMKTLKLVCFKSDLFIRSLKPAIFDLFPPFVLDKFCVFCYWSAPSFSYYCHPTSGSLFYPLDDSNSFLNQSCYLYSNLSLVHLSWCSLSPYMSDNIPIFTYSFFYFLLFSGTWKSVFVIFLSFSQRIKD